MNFKKAGKELICRNNKTQFRKKKNTHTHILTKRANEMNVSRSFITEQRKQTSKNLYILRF